MKHVRLLVALLAVVALLVTAGVVSAQRPGGPGGRGGPPSFDKLLEAFDDNVDDKLSEDEVPPWVWMRLSQADANEDGIVTKAEFEAYRKGK